jgi:Flp pilus assembly protein TadD
MKSLIRVKERNGAWRQLPVGEAVVEASRSLRQGDAESALRLLEKAVQYAPLVPAYRYLLGIAQVRHKLYGLAISNLREVVRLDGSNVDYLLSLGEVLMTEKPLEAIPFLARAVALGSKAPEAYSKLAALLLDKQEPEEALRVCDLGLKTCEAHAGIVGSRGLALSSLGRYEEALEGLQRAEALLPRDATTALGIGTVLIALGRVVEARSYMERAASLDPNSAEARFGLGLTLLLLGHYREGFREYEARWRTRQMMGRQSNFAGPVWDGSELQGRRVLLHPEQGAGDTIQFVRYAGFVRARGGRVVLLVPPALVRLMSWLGDCEVATLGGSVPATYDVHCALLSLPRIAGTEVDTVPAPAQFVVPSEMKEKWNGILGEKLGLRVGIVWAGNANHRNDRNRSLACRLFAPLLEIAGAQWFSLQVGPSAGQLAEDGTRNKIRDLAPELTDYAETAAAISQLDLVISADTSVAHLAGSLGKAVWMLTPFAPDWRWLLDRDDSPWYPSMRLFRQQAVGDWENVMQSVAESLRRLTTDLEPRVSTRVSV